MLKLFCCTTAFGAALLAAPKADADEMCFTRSYSAAHLASHPQQLVTSMKLRIYDEPKYEPPMGWSMKVTRRGERRALMQIGLCGRGGLNAKDELHCFVECDGGAFDVSFKGKDSLLLKLQREMSMRSDCGSEDDDSVLSPGVDDKVFRLDRMPPDVCRDLD